MMIKFIKKSLENDVKKMGKKRPKKLLQENLPNLFVVKITQRNQPEQLIARETNQEVVAINERDMKSLRKLSKQIRKEILS